MNRQEVKGILNAALSGGYAVGSFSPRNTVLIRSVLESAEELRAPVIVQISSNEFRWFSLDARRFAEAFRAELKKISVPAVLHLDHTRDLDGIVAAVEAGFDSVMIDASALDFEENVRLTSEAAGYAHARDVAVEAELGRIGAADKIETENDSELYTVPEEAEEFARRTGVDSLAVSVGTAHGVYAVKNPTIDFRRLKDIFSLVRIPLVLHGGSGLPESVLRTATAGHGVGKLNIATDLELAFLEALGRKDRLSNAESESLGAADREKAVSAVKAVVSEKIRLLGGAGRAAS